MHMSVCVSINISMCMSISPSLRFKDPEQVCTCVCTHVCTYACLHACLCTCLYAHVCTPVCTHACTPVCTHSHGSFSARQVPEDKTFRPYSVAQSQHTVVHARLFACLRACLIGPSLLVKDPQIKLKIAQPFTSKMALDYFDMSGTFTFPALNDFSFAATGNYRAAQGGAPGSLIVQTVFGEVRSPSAVLSATTLRLRSKALYAHVRMQMCTSGHPTAHAYTNMSPRASSYACLIHTPMHMPMYVHTHAPCLIRKVQSTILLESRVWSLRRRTSPWS